MKQIEVVRLADVSMQTDGIELRQYVHAADVTVDAVGKSERRSVDTCLPAVLPAWIDIRSAATAEFPYRRQESSRPRDAYIHPCFRVV